MLVTDILTVHGTAILMRQPQQHGQHGRVHEPVSSGKISPLATKTSISFYFVNSTTNKSLQHTER